MSKLLIDDKPVVVLPKLAVAIGMNEAIVLQQVHYWLMIYKDADAQDHHRDGAWWVYNTGGGWQENFPWWSEKTVRRILASLRDMKLLKTTSKYNKFGPDRTLWYTIDYKKLEEIEKVIEKGICPDCPNAANGQNDQMEVDNLSTAIPETTTENTREQEPVFVDTKTEPPETHTSKDTVPTNTLAPTAPKKQEEAQPSSTLPGMETYTNKPTSEDDTRILEEYSRVRRGQGRRGSRKFMSAGVKSVWREVLQIAEEKYNGRHWDAVLQWVELADEEGISSQAGFFKYMRGCARNDKGAGSIPEKTTAADWGLKEGEQVIDPFAQV